jgi:hypothetical protein
LVNGIYFAARAEVFFNTSIISQLWKFIHARSALSPQNIGAIKFMLIIPAMRGSNKTLSTKIAKNTKGDYIKIISEEKKCVTLSVPADGGNTKNNIIISKIYSPWWWVRRRTFIMCIRLRENHII